MAFWSKLGSEKLLRNHRKPLAINLTYLVLKKREGGRENSLDVRLKIIVGLE